MFSVRPTNADLIDRPTLMDVCYVSVRPTNADLIDRPFLTITPTIRRIWNVHAFMFSFYPSWNTLHGAVRRNTIKRISIQNRD